MKTTLELPESLLQQATSVAASNGLPLGAFVADAIQAKLAASLEPLSRPWMKHFGSLRHLHSESQLIEKIVSNEFEGIDEQDWR